VYFIVAAVLMIVTALVFLKFKKLPFVVYHLERDGGQMTNYEEVAKIDNEHLTESDK
jgi:hypothetical protein